MKRRAPQPIPDPTLPTDFETLQTQLKLARAQNAYLHRELATALKQGPLAPTSAVDERDALILENANLRARLNALTRHYEDLTQRYTHLEGVRADLDTAYTKLLRSLGGHRGDPAHPALVEESGDLLSTLTHLLTIAHPDK